MLTSPEQRRSIYWRPSCFAVCRCMALGICHGWYNETTPRGRPLHLIANFLSHPGTRLAEPSTVALQLIVISVLLINHEPSTAYVLYHGALVGLIVCYILFIGRAP